MTQVSEISFCSRIGYNIKTDEAKKKILEGLEQTFKFKVIQKHYEKFDPPISIQKLRNNPHLISVRTNGNPYLLYFTKLNFINQCIFVDKKVQSGYFLPRIILSKFRFHDDLFENGTLIDGEMVKDKNGNWIFIICDIIGYKGVYLENTNLVKRLNIIYEILEHQFKPDEYDVCHFQVKKYFPYQDLNYILNEFIPSLRYTCRGLYFKPLFIKFKNILFNFDDTLIQKVMRRKYKSVSNFLTLEDTQNLLIKDTKKITSVASSNSIQHEQNAEKNFYVVKTTNPDVYQLYTEDTQNLYGTACIPTLKISKMMRKLFQDLNLTDKVFMKCLLSDKFEGKYIPHSVIESR
jgi:hypothetical protein